MRLSHRSITTLILLSSLGCLTALVVLTRALWIPQSVFPQVPFWNVALLQTKSVQVAALGACGLGGVLIASRALFEKPATATAGVVLVLLAFFVLVAGDQHRLQPWLLHLTGVLTICVLCPDPRRCLRWLTAGIYFHSAASRLDYSFLFGGGDYLLNGLLNVLGAASERWPDGLIFAATLFLPLGELLVAVLLLRRDGLSGWRLAACMHVVLLLALGPLGLNHAPPVLVWNLFFLVQALVLPAAPRADGSVSDAPALPVLIVVCLVGLPFFNWEPFHVYDHWPAWSLYASRGEKVVIEIHIDAAPRLDANVALHLAEPPPFSDWQQLRVDRWSLAAVNAPIYPEDRFWLGVAIQLAHEYDLRNKIRVRIQTVANRLSGQRGLIELNGTAAIEDFAAKFWLNASPTESVR